MAIICRQYKLLFIMVPATGSSAISQVLKDELDGKFLPEKDIMKGNYRLLDKKHNTVDELVKFNLISTRELRTYLKFATVRNPFDRFATEYQRIVGIWMENLIKNTDSNFWFNRTTYAYRKELIIKNLKMINRTKKEGFEKWLLRRLALNQHSKKGLVTSLQYFLKRNYIHQKKKKLLYPMLEGIDEIIRYENIEHDFKKVLNKVEFNKKISLPIVNKTPDKEAYINYYTPELKTLIYKKFYKELSIFNYTCL